MPRKTGADENGNMYCCKCGETKNEKHFNRGDSYCKPCRKEYARDYHARRKVEDKYYLAIKARKARLKYHSDPKARVARLESSRRYWSRKRAAKKDRKTNVDDKWSDLME